MGSPAPRSADSAGDEPDGVGTVPSARRTNSRGGVPPRPDAETLARAFRGDKSAFQSVVEQLWGLIYVFVRQRVNDNGRAEDLTQDTFLQGWEKRATLRDPDRAISWLLAIASRKVIDAHRWRGARPESQFPERLDPSGGPEPESAFDEEQSDEIREALAELPELYRTVLILRYWSGLSPAQIARLLAEPEGTIRNRIFRAHLQLRRQMNQDPDPRGDDSAGEAPKQ